MSAAHPRHRRFGSDCLDTQTRELRSADGSALPLTTKAFDTLHCLIDHHVNTSSPSTEVKDSL